MHSAMSCKAGFLVRSVRRTSLEKGRSPPTLCRWEHDFLASTLAEEVIGPPSKLGGAVETPTAIGMPSKPRMPYYIRSFLSTISL